jgi:hypothetical protein
MPQHAKQDTYKCKNHSVSGGDATAVAVLVEVVELVVVISKDTVLTQLLSSLNLNWDTESQISDLRINRQPRFEFVKKGNPVKIISLSISTSSTSSSTSYTYLYTHARVLFCCFVVLLCSSIVVVIVVIVCVCVFVFVCVCVCRGRTGGLDAKRQWRDIDEKQGVGGMGPVETRRERGSTSGREREWGSGRVGQSGSSVYSLAVYVHARPPARPTA